MVAASSIKRVRKRSASRRTVVAALAAGDGEDGNWMRFEVELAMAI